MFEEKYDNAFSFYDRMSRHIPEDRPDCTEILSQNELWALNKLDSDTYCELEKSIREHERNSTIYSMLKIKLGG
jgi:hypothetical protein